MNSSITCSTFKINPLYFLLFILIIPKSLNLSLVVVDLNHFLSNLRHENDLSAVAVVAGIERYNFKHLCPSGNSCFKFFLWKWRHYFIKIITIQICLLLFIAHESFTFTFESIQIYHAAVGLYFFYVYFFVVITSSEPFVKLY